MVRIENKFRVLFLFFFLVFEILEYLPYIDPASALTVFFADFLDEGFKYNVWKGKMDQL